MKAEVIKWLSPTGRVAPQPQRRYLVKRKGGVVEDAYLHPVSLQWFGYDGYVFPDIDTVVAFAEFPKGPSK